MMNFSRESFIGGMAVFAAAIGSLSAYSAERSLQGMDLYLLMGQSNMAGCGVLSADEARKTDFTRVSRCVSRYVSRDGKIRLDSDAAYREEMKAAAERLIAYETANPSVFVGWHWSRYYQSKAYTLLGRTPPGKDPKKFGEL